MSFQIGDSVPSNQIRNDLGRNNWVIEKIEPYAEEYPNLHLNMIENGYDGSQYVLVSEPTGRQRKARRLVCWFGANSKTFSSIL